MKLTVLFALHQFFPEHFAGVEILTLGLARELKARGHEPYVFAAKRSFPIHDMEPGEIEDYEYNGIPVRRVGRPKEGLSLHYRLNYENETMADRAREYVREIGPDVVHAMNFHGLSASVIPAFKEFGMPLCTRRRTSGRSVRSSISGATTGSCAGARTLPTVPGA